MPREIALLDALVPSLLLIFFASLVVQKAIDSLFVRLEFYRHVWHPPLFRTALFCGVFATLGLISLL